MKFLILFSLIFISCGLTASEKGNAKPLKVDSKVQAETFSLQLLNTAKAAQGKLQAKQDCAAELKAIIETKKTVEAARLKAAAEFTQQQAALESRKSDKAALEALETQRKAMNTRCNELSRLIDQVDKNQKTALLPEKLNDLIVFLEPAASETAEKEAAKAPPKPLSRGAAPVKEKAAPSQK